MGVQMWNALVEDRQDEYEKHPDVGNEKISLTILELLLRIPQRVDAGI